MTHADIFEKFMIEYDKANITSSYPSLTDYEIATILDKAYLALIALKYTGTSFRKAPLEFDGKAIEDIQALITSQTALLNTSYNNIASNEYVYDKPMDQLYYIGGLINIDSLVYNVNLIPHQVANNYKVTATNLPWIEKPVCYMENDEIHVLIDAYKHSDPKDMWYVVLYIKTPNKFVDDYQLKSSAFELNDSMAEELINLAIIMSLEIVESTRLDNKIKTAVLES